MIDYENPYDFAMSQQEKQKEQKPVEWDELQAEFRSINEAFEDGKKEVIAHPEKYDLCKPAEWSEEDEEIFNNIIEKAKGGHWIEVNEITWLITRFKSLRPQGSKDSLQTHWKPSEEWNEEDKQYFDDLIARIEKSRRTNRCYVYTDDVDWLKSKLNGNSGK